MSNQFYQFGQPVPQPVPPPPPKKMSVAKVVFITLASVVGAIVLFVVIASLATLSTTTSSTMSSQSDGKSYTESSPEPTEPASKGYSPRNSDVTLEWKQKSKKCYGEGWGCTLEGDVRIKSFNVVPPEGGTITVYFRLSGDEDGPVDGTLTVDCDGMHSTYSPDYQYLTTSGRGQKISVRVTQIEYLG